MTHSKIYKSVAGWVCLLMLGIFSASAQTFNLHTIEPDVIPVGSVLEWHSALPVTTVNLISSTNAAAVSPGIYYAVYKNGSCSSAPSAFKIVKPDCGSDLTDLYQSVDTTGKPSGTTLSFHTAKPVDLSNRYPGDAHAAPAGTYYAAYYDSVKDCYTSGTPVKVIPNLICSTDPDINITHLNISVDGNVHTNDNVPDGTTYGVPLGNPGNPTMAVPAMNPDGSYSFTPTDTGVYVFEVPVCPSDTAVSCVTETLTITVVDPYGTTNPPVVNPDIAVVDSGGMVTVPVLDNDQPGNPGGHLGTPTATDPPNGTVAVTPEGEITYIPDPGFTGTDTFTYTVCDTSSNPELCRTTTVTVDVSSYLSSDEILAADDFVRTPMNTTVAGNVTLNDIDPDGGPIKVAAQGANITGVGSFMMDTSGDYSFVPVNNFFGPVQIPYTVCDTAGHCASATLHILVDPVNFLEPDFGVTNINVPVTGNMSVNDELVPGSTFGVPAANAGNPTSQLPDFDSDGSYSFTPTAPGLYIFEVPVCAPSQAAPCPTETLTITVLDPAGTTFPPVVNPDNATGSADSTITIPVLVNDDPTSPGGSFGVPVISTPPSNGMAVVTPDGSISYIPVPGFTGVDSFTYTVCDTAVAPDQCGSATVTVQVLPPNATNSVAANDDYANTYGTVPATGNVLLNDSDPENDILSVNPQNITNAAGTLSLLANGNYIFTPASGFSGTASYIYTACDNAEPQACDRATLHILVDKAPDYTPQVYIDQTTFTATDTAGEFVVAISNVNNTVNKGQIQFFIAQESPRMIISIDSMATISGVFGGFPVKNQRWSLVKSGEYYVLTLKPGLVMNAGGSQFIGFKVRISPDANQNQSFSLSPTIVPASGGDNNISNNSFNVNLIKN